MRYRKQSIHRWNKKFSSLELTRDVASKLFRYKVCADGHADFIIYKKSKATMVLYFFVGKGQPYAICMKPSDAMSFANWIWHTMMGNFVEEHTRQLYKEELKKLDKKRMSLIKRRSGKVKIIGRPPEHIEV
jgi:hypothetical protein